VDAVSFGANHAVLVNINSAKYHQHIPIYRYIYIYDNKRKSYIYIIDLQLFPMFSIFGVPNVCWWTHWAWFLNTQPRNMTDKYPLVTLWKISITLIIYIYTYISGSAWENQL
jgi:hypothetical protein